MSASTSPAPGTPEFAHALAMRRASLRHSASLLSDMMAASAQANPAPVLPTPGEVTQAMESLRNVMTAAHADPRFAALSEQFEISPLRERDRATAEIDIVGAKAVYARTPDGNFLRMDVFVSAGRARIVPTAVGAGKRLGIGRKSASSLAGLDSALSDVMADQVRQVAHAGVVAFEGPAGYYQHSRLARVLSQPA